MWLKRVAGLTAEKQVEEVGAKLRELNPMFDGKLKPIIDGGVVTELILTGSNLKDLAPLRAFTGLQKLNCSHTQVSDLSPLRGMKLTSLDCADTPIANFSPLRVMSLKTLKCDFDFKRDAKVLRSIKTLERINGKEMSQFWKHAGIEDDAWTKSVVPMPAEKQLAAVAAKLVERNPTLDGKLPGLSPEARVFSNNKIQNGVVTEIYLKSGNLVDISPLRAFKSMHTLNCSGTKVSDLSPLMGLHLRALDCSNTSVDDLSPLRGMSLTALYCLNTKVTDFSPLRGMPLLDLKCDFDYKRDAKVLRSINTLVRINGRETAQFWKDVSGK